MLVVPGIGSLVHLGNTVTKDVSRDILHIPSLHIVTVLPVTVQHGISLLKMQVKQACLFQGHNCCCFVDTVAAATGVVVNAAQCQQQ